MEIWYDENGELNLTPTPKLPRIRSGPPRGVGCGSAGGPEEAEAINLGPPDPSRGATQGLASQGQASSVVGLSRSDVAGKPYVYNNNKPCTSMIWKWQASIHFCH